MSSNRAEFVENREKVIAALNGKWPMAEWVDKNEWDEWHCSACQAYGDIEDRFCPKCGCFMRNYEMAKRYHYNCKHCGASLDSVNSYSIVGPDTENDAPQVFTFECPACGQKSDHTFDDARIEFEYDGFNERFLEQLRRADNGREADPV